MNRASRFVAALVFVAGALGCKGEPCPDKPLTAPWSSLGSGLVPPGAHVCQATTTRLDMEVEGKTAEQVLQVELQFASKDWKLKEKRDSSVGVAQRNFVKGGDLIVVGVAPHEEKRGIALVYFDLRKIPPSDK